MERNINSNIQLNSIKNPRCWIKKIYIKKIENVNQNIQTVFQIFKWWIQIIK